MEIQAIQEILQSCENNKLQLITSDSLEAEIHRDPNVDRQERAFGILSLATIKVRWSEELSYRVTELMQIGLTTYDAAHLASAEKGNADVFFVHRR